MFLVKDSLKYIACQKQYDILFQYDILLLNQTIRKYLVSVFEHGGIIFEVQ